MKKICIGKIVCGAMACLCLVSGCAKDNGQKSLQEESLEAQKDVGQEESLGAQKGGQPEENQEGSNVSQEPEILETDWSEYFDGLVGAAVLYDPSNMRYSIFEPELALTQRPPCSTFKIIASLIALEQGVIEPEDSTRAWSGEVFWNEKWNHDIDFHEAFRESCVWYFREVIDEIGKEQIQQGLDKLQYGNCDSSDWEGRLNTNNNNHFCVYLGRSEGKEVSSAVAKEIAIRLVQDYLLPQQP